MANWDNISRKGKIIDRRGMAPVLGGIGLTGIVAILAVNFLLGGDLGDAVTMLEQVPIQKTQEQNNPEFEGEDSYEIFASRVLGSSDSLWEQKIESYPNPQLVLFRTATTSSCGSATSEVGPHYCPTDQTIYLDETFFDEMKKRFGATGGDVAEAYVIAHEVGHHVQNISGTLDTALRAQQLSRDPNEIQIQVELQADCYAGIWANSLKDEGIFLPGEIKEAMDAAASVGDDRIQEKVTGQVSPEKWTHGSSEMRVEAFTRGYESGDTSVCAIDSSVFQ